MMNIDNWANPEYLYLLLVIPLLIVWYWFKNRTVSADLRFSGLQIFSDMKTSPKTWLIHGLFVLRMIAIALLIVALARPQSISTKQKRVMRSR